MLLKDLEKLMDEIDDCKQREAINDMSIVAYKLYGITINEQAKAIDLLSAVKAAYRKHHMGDESIGWEELSEILHCALFNVMGQNALEKWRSTINT